MSPPFAAGRLVITGSASAPGVVVTIWGTSLKSTAGADKKFSFNTDYRTSDCGVWLLTSTGRLRVLVADCGPGAMPQGNWSSTALYSPGDLAVYGGETYQALKLTRNNQPSSLSTYWQPFAGPETGRGNTGKCPSFPAG